MAGLEFTILLPHPSGYYNSFILLRKKTKHQQQRGFDIQQRHTKDVCSTKIEESTPDFPPWKSYG